MKFSEIISKIKSLVTDEEIRESGESLIPENIREALLHGSIEAIKSDIESAVDNKNIAGFCSCSTSPERAENSYSTLRIEGTFTNGTVVISCWKCRNWWMANWSKNDQGQVVFSNIKPAAQVVVAMESARNNSEDEIQIDESAVTLQEGLGMDENGIIKDACAINSGWGSCGYYGADVLQKEAASFSGLQMFADHPTTIEESTIPERSIKNLAAVLTNTTFKENGWKGPGVYGDVKVFSDFQEPIMEKAPFIGLSLYGRGKAKIGEAEGKTGKIIESIPYKRSVDFVTKAGAGGALMPLLESARKPEGTEKPNESSHKEPVKESDTGSEVVVIKESKDKELIEVPVTEQEFNALKESIAQLTPLKEAVAQKDTVIAEQAKKLAKLEEKDMIREAQTIVTNLVESAKVPQVTKNRLNAELVDTPLTEAGELDKAKLTENVKTKIAEAEAEIATIVGSGKVVGMGGGGNEPASIKESVQKEMDEMFGLEPVEEAEKK